MPRPGKETWYPFYRTLGGPWCWSGWVRKTLAPPGFEPRTLHPVVSHYTDHATQVTHMSILGSINNDLISCKKFCCEIYVKFMVKVWRLDF